jgi:hypothetical protein
MSNPPSNITTKVTDVFFFVNSTAVHAAPALMNLFSEALARQTLLKPTFKIKTHSVPFALTYSQRFMRDVVAVLALGLAAAFLPATVAARVVGDGASKARHHLLLCGPSVRSYWLGHFTFDALGWLLTGAALVSAIGLHDVPSLLSTALPPMLVLFVMYGLAMLPFVYCLSFLFQKSSALQARNVIFFMTIVIGPVLSLLMLVMGQMNATRDAATIFKISLRVLPPFAFSEASIDLALRQTTFVWGARMPEWSVHSVLEPSFRMLLVAGFYLGLLIAIECEFAFLFFFKKERVVPIGVHVCSSIFTQPPSFTLHYFHFLLFSFSPFILSFLSFFTASTDVATRSDRRTMFFATTVHVALLSFTFHSHFINISFTFHSHFIHISFTFHSHFIHISFISSFLSFLDVATRPDWQNKFFGEEHAMARALQARGEAAVAAAKRPGRYCITESAHKSHTHFAFPR